MSNITHVLLITAIDDPGVQKIQDYLFETEGSDLRETGNIAGGNKVMECDVWAGAFNHFDLKNFIKRMVYVHFENPDSVQVLTKGENENRFTSHPLSQYYSFW